MPRFDFQNRRGQSLTGNLELPQGTPKAYAVFAHCLTCSKNIRAASQISKKLAELGFAVLRFDFTGLGNSEGDFGNTNFSSNVTDLIDAAAALRDRETAPSLLIGHSLGGAAALMAAGEIEGIRAVATIGAPSEPAHVAHLFGDSISAITAAGAATVKLGGREFTIEKQFLDDLQSNSLVTKLPKLRKPLMILHSPVDTVVSIENARKIYETAKHPKSFVSIDNADHMLSRDEDSTFVSAMLAAWASHYVPKETDTAETVGETLSEGTVVVREVDGGLTQDVQTASHEFSADEPRQLGGNDAGPNPYELLLASLGSCISMTLRMYAQRKDWPVDSIEVRLSHSRIHAEDCQSCETKDGQIDRIDKMITVTGEIDESHLDRLKEIADRCPVHRTLTNEKVITTQMQQG